jgi:hypothetical protein
LAEDSSEEVWTDHRQRSWCLGVGIFYFVVCFGYRLDAFVSISSSHLFCFKKYLDIHHLGSILWYQTIVDAVHVVLTEPTP